MDSSNASPIPYLFKHGYKLKNNTNGQHDILLIPLINGNAFSNQMRLHPGWTSAVIVENARKGASRLRYTPTALAMRLHSEVAMGYNYKSPLIISKGTGKNGALTSHDYCEQILKMHRLKDLKPLAAVFQDGNPAHGLKSKENVPTFGNERKCLDWAAVSPTWRPFSTCGGR